MCHSFVQIKKNQHSFHSNEWPFCLMTIFLIHSSPIARYGTHVCCKPVAKIPRDTNFNAFEFIIIIIKSISCILLFQNVDGVGTTITNEAMEHEQCESERAREKEKNNVFFFSLIWTNEFKRFVACVIYRLNKTDSFQTYDYFGMLCDNKIRKEI